MTNFIFLKKLNQNAYILASRMEQYIFSAPAAVKADATTFLEEILNDLFNKNQYRFREEYSQNKDFSAKTIFLFEHDIIDFQFKNMLLDAYSLRSTIHDDLVNVLETEQEIALKLHKKIFEISWKYYTFFSVSKVDYFGKPKYIQPTLDIEEEIDENQLQIKINNVHFDNCVVCGNRNTSKDSNLCKECINKINIVEDVLNLKNQLGENNIFTKKDIVELSIYSKPYINSLIRELLDVNLLIKKNNAYKFNNYNFDKFLNDVKLYDDINRLLSEFVSGKFKLDQIKNTAYYKNGEKGILPYIQFYNIVNETVFSKFLEEVDLGIPIEDILKGIPIGKLEINNWFIKQRHNFLNGQHNDSFINFNKKLMEQYLILKRQEYSNNEIKDKLNINDDIINFWLNSFEMDSIYFTNELKQIKLNLFLKAIKENQTKEKASILAEISLEEIMEYYNCGKNGDDNYKSFYLGFKAEYFDKRREEFLKKLKTHNLEISINESKLSKEDIDKWYLNGRKQFFSQKHLDNFCLDFFLKMTKYLMKHYLKAREAGYSRVESASKINLYHSNINEWLKVENNEIFENFRYNNEQITVKLLTKYLSIGNSLEEALNKVEISNTQFNEYLNQAKEGNELYLPLYDIYQNSYLPNQFDIFLSEIKNKPKHKALKNVSLTNKQLEEYYLLGKKGYNENYKKLYEEYLIWKIDSYISKVIKGKSSSQALRSSNLSKEEFEEFEECINKKICKKQVKIVTDEIKKDKTTNLAAKKANISVNTIFDWYIQGQEENSFFYEFAQFYYDSYIELGVKAIQTGLNKGISIKDILKGFNGDFTKDDYNFWNKQGLLDKDIVIEFDMKENKKSEEKGFDMDSNFAETLILTKDDE